MTFLAWAAAAGAVVTASAVLLDRWALAVIRPVRRHPSRHPDELAHRHEDVVIPAEYPLRAWVVVPETEPAGTPRAAVVLSHGWAANAAVLLDLADALAERGHPVVLADFRGHGRSATAPFATICQYRDDVVAVARWTAARYPGRPLVLVGHSMGGAASVLAVADGLPVAGLALVATPADVLEATASYISDRGLPGRLVVGVLKPFWARRTPGPYARLVPGKRLSDVRVPVLVIQPSADRRVPLEHARQLAGAAGSELRVVKGADHASILTHRETVELLDGFMDAVAAGAVRTGPEGAAGTRPDEAVSPR